MKFELPTELSSIIKVVGVGGGGSNAVNHMHAHGIRGVDFIICNTDKQALDISKVPVKLQIGTALTEGLGAGAQPERGKGAAQENIDEIRQLLSSRTKMVFITAGMGGGTGTGAAPVIAQVAREMGILTVGIVTMPFSWEGRRRKQQAAAGVEELRNVVDTLLVINNDRLRDLYGNLSMDEAFGHADNVLTTAARGIAEIITTTGTVNVDFEDVRTVMTSSGVAIMGMAEAEGEDRAIRAATEALASPLLNDSDISGAKYVLLNIALGDKNLSMDEMTEVTEHIQDAAGSTADVIWGYCQDESLGDRVRVTVIATGFGQSPLDEAAPGTQERKVIPLETDLPTMITAPIQSPVGSPVAKPVEAPQPPKVSSEPFLRTIEPEQKPVPAPAPPPAPPVVVQEQRRLEFEEAQAAVEQEQQPAAPGKVVHTLYSTEEPSAQTSEESPKAEQVPAPVVTPPVVVAPPVVPVAQAAPAAPVAPRPAQPARTPAGDFKGEVHMPAPAEHQSRVDERLARIREMSMRLRSPNGLADLEREPAFKRKNVQLADGPTSSDSSVSRYTLSETTDEQGRRTTELKKNNPFLHDNVD